MNSFNEFINKSLERLSDFMCLSEIEEFRQTLNFPEQTVIQNPALQKERPDDIAEKIELNENHRIFFDRFITLAEARLSLEKHLIFLQNIGQYSISIGQFSLASEIYKSVLRKVSRKKNFNGIVAYANFYLGDIASRQAQWKESLQFIQKARKIFVEQNDLKGQAMCENLTGIIYGEQGILQKAFYYMEKSLSILGEINDIALSAMIENNLGIMNTIKGDLEHAYMYYCRALTKFDELKDVRRIVEVRHNLGMLFLQKKEFEHALNELGISIRLSLKENQMTMLGLSYTAKAFIYALTNDVDLASVYADKGMEISYKLNDKLSIADIYKVKGIVFRKKKSYGVAESYFLSSLRLNEELENQLNFAETCFELGILYDEMNKPETKQKYLKKSYDFYKRIGHKTEMEKIRIMMNGGNPAVN